MRSSRRLRVLAAAALAAAAIALVVALGRDWWSGGGDNGLGTRATLVKTSVSPITARFGDAVTATADVLVNPRVVDPGSVRLETSFAPYDVATERDTRRSIARDAHLRYRFDLVCLTQACLSTGDQRTFRFPRARLVAREQGRGTTSTPVSWPTLLVATRLTPDDVALQQPPFRASVALDAPSYSISPDLLGSLLLAAAALLVLVGVVAIRPRLVGAIPLQLRLSPLQRALSLIRHAGSHEDEERRRKALERLAHELDARGESSLAADAGRLAWSDGAPSRDSIEALADEVEKIVDVR